jgi:hypothetical protein
VHRVRGEAAWLHDHDVGKCLVELATSCEQFERAHAARAACLTRLNMATLMGWAGAPAEGLELAARSEAEASRLGADFLLRYGRAVRGVLLVYSGRPEADAVMREAQALVGGSPRLSFLCQIIIGSLALARGDLDEAGARADAARGIAVAAELRPAGAGLGARVLSARGRFEEAAVLAQEAAREERGCRDLELTWGLAGIALAEARQGVGSRDGAREALGPVLARLSAVASTLASIDHARFWERALPNTDVRRLAERLGMAS